MPLPLINVVNTAWRPELAYAVGLMASDGHLRPDNKQVSLVSKDRELIDLFRQAIALDKLPFRSGRGGTKLRNYWTLRFKSKNFHDFLVSVGVTPRKSKTIREVLVPDQYFADFLRGLFDGDGTFWIWWDKRWPNAFGFTLGFSSASPLFVAWLKGRLTEMYGVKGYVHKGAGAFTIRYVKRDTRKLFVAMYHGGNSFYLSRKYNKIRTALDFDEKLKHARIAQRAAVAQW